MCRQKDAKSLKIQPRKICRRKLYGEGIFQRLQRKEVSLYTDAKCKFEEIFEVIEKAKEIIRSQPEKSVCTLTDVTDTPLER